MITTYEDASLIFGRWQDTAPPLRVKLLTNALVFEATGAVTEYSHTTLQLSGAAWQFTIPIEGARYTFSDPREIPIASVRDLESAKYEFGLALELPTGDRLVLMELKKTSEAPTQDEAESD